MDQVDLKKQGRAANILTIDEVAARLGISRNSAYAAAARGEIPTIRIGRLLRVPEAQLNRKLGLI